MNFEFFIAKRLVYGKESRDSLTGTRSIGKISTLAVTLGMVVMILSIAIVVGFKQEIRNKVIGFGAHIVVNYYDDNSSFETLPVNKNMPFYPSITENEGISHIQVYATKPGIIKTEKDIQGIVLKGVGSDYKWSFFEPNITEGKLTNYTDTAISNKVIISKYLANLLNIGVGDNFRTYFVQDPPRARKFEITGIYETGLEEFDKLFVICDIQHINKLNNWKKDEVSGFEILIDDYDRLGEMTDLVKNTAGFVFMDDGSSLRTQNIGEVNPQIFDWLNLIDTNVWVILILMTVVASFNMVSGLLILILERTRVIGILKSMGMTNGGIRKVFLYQAVFLIGKGLLWGNVIGIALCLIQKYFGVIKLDAASYYVDTVPVNLRLFHLLILNIGTTVVTVLFLLLPSMIIAKITPEKTIRYD